MAEYKCINCGNIKDSKKECTCPVCGYKMFPAPYDRSEILIKEIRNYIGKLKITEIDDDDMFFFRREKRFSADKEIIISKEKDDERFPDYKTIKGFILAAEKTEMFKERLDRSIDQVRKHLHEEFSQDYEVSFDKLEGRAEILDEELQKVFSVLFPEDTPELELGQIDAAGMKLDYREEPDTELIEIADEILDALDSLSDKMITFIKKNNIYGTVYRQEVKRHFKPSKDRNHQEDLNKCLEQIETELDKNHVIDLLSDGTEELKGMLKALWVALQAVLTVPVRKKEYNYTFKNGDTAAGDEVKVRVLQNLSTRYSEVDALVYASDFLSDKTEEELLETYDALLEVDTLGLMGLEKQKLIKVGKSEKKLEKLIGLAPVKESIKKIKAYVLANKDSEDLNIHMCFYGNPGTGKTEVARIIAGILHENKILPTDKVVEVDRGGLVGQYVGETPQKTMAKIMEAMGGVLFIDEAYALIPKDGGSWDYGQEAVATLIKAMEDHRGEFCVILAGYRNEMLQMLSSNPGFRSRIQFELDFPNYSRDELKEISALMLSKKGYTAGEMTLERMLDITDIKRKDPNFANAREVRNILDQVIMCQNIRTAGTKDKELGLVDVNKYIKDAKINLPQTGEGYDKKVMTGDEELDQLVGLESVKRMVKKIRAYAKRNKGEDDFNIHMCFYGNPGTGKTEVARIMSRILYDAGVLGEAKLVETDPHGLIGQYVGETAPKTLAKINDAMDGVLFIDEAYGLAASDTSDGGVSSYGEEAIEVLLKEMEDRRGQFCAILAGYKDEMQTMIGSNPGLKSRIQFTLEFPDYSRDELGQIASKILDKKKYEIEPEALEKVLDITEYYRKQPDFANARTVRNILDQVIMNQNLRTEDEGADSMIILQDVEDYLTDEGIDLSETGNNRRGTIGFL